MATVQKNWLMPEEDAKAVDEFMANPVIQEKLATIRTNAGFGEIMRRVFKNGWPATQRQLLNDN